MFLPRNFCRSLDGQLDELHLLKHPFYLAWNQGDLDIETIRTYSAEYYSHVSAFPRYISCIHSLCEDIKSRQILLENLIEEEQGEENHPELWLRFAEGLGISREHIPIKANLVSTNNLVDGYFRLVRSDYATGIGALYAYERQTPEVSESKIDGLKKHYGIIDDNSLKFFQVHSKIDNWHREQIEGLIEGFAAEDRQKAVNGALSGAKLLWEFLDGVLVEN
jgi:pyrroloquinoline-quinone synthase